MEPIEIVVIIACVLIVGGVIVTSIINKKRGKTSCCGDCSKCKCCHTDNKDTNRENGV